MALKFSHVKRINLLQQLCKFTSTFNHPFKRASILSSYIRKEKKFALGALSTTADGRSLHPISDRLKIPKNPNVQGVGERHQRVSHFFDERAATVLPAGRVARGCRDALTVPEDTRARRAPQVQGPRTRALAGRSALRRGIPIPICIPNSNILKLARKYEWHLNYVLENVLVFGR